ncbi:hypothetical protein RCL_jg23393.t1 [Rhizophagus clarus]|uniref:Uncharacterized protein n=1 Tax=Rhizophagus clarus TaxID=94130 RepID=A0A8H3L469_9GLOM|nr:hypothetical protein RCL_jg23393.t1 [Rhizophagus clarus]
MAPNIIRSTTKHVKNFLHPRYLSFLREDDCELCLQYEFFRESRFPKYSTNISNAKNPLQIVISYWINYQSFIFSNPNEGSFHSWISFVDPDHPKEILGLSWSGIWVGSDNNNSE